MHRKSTGRKAPRVVEGRVRELTRRGEAVIDTPDGPVFAPLGLPGERVRVRRESRKGGRWHGQIEEVIEASEARIAPACPLRDRCGGCPLMALDPPAQQAYKRALVHRALAKGGASGVEVEWIASDRPLGYRRRARLQLAAPGPAGDAGRARLGYRGFRSHHVVNVAECAVLVPALQDALSTVRSRWLPTLAGQGELQLALGEGERPVAWLRSQAVQAPLAYDAAAALVLGSGFAGVALLAGGATAPARFGDPREWAVGWDGAPLVGPVHGFAQANEAANRDLVARVRRWAAPQGAQVLELFAGQGNLTVALAPDAAGLAVVEQDPSVAEACRENLARRGLAATVRTGRADEAAAGPKVDVVVLDPPREGAAEAIPGILGRRPARIVYVSCEPATLGRDLALLGEGGYRARSAAAVDMFPQTAHVEALVLLVPTR